MKKIYISLTLVFALSTTPAVSQGIFCNPQGNIAIFSNYDGGILRINVDMNIPNLKIGITGYENDSIIISGMYINNVTQVIFTGYFNSTNIHCTPWPSVKSITGVPAAITQINFMPPVTYFNPYGYSSIVCNYSCSVNSSQGGCNTADQVAGYFFSQFGGTDLLFHFTQYGCWNSPYSLSAGGNCCAVPPTTGIDENVLNDFFEVIPNPGDGLFTIRNPKFEIRNYAVYNMLGDVVNTKTENEIPVNLENFELNLSNQPAGIYLLKISDGGNVLTKKIVIE
ncbi:MAG: T9SS type A sorting domain-containing protein [Bacteroidia bacterium]